LKTIAALFVDPAGPYPRMPNVECWDEQRDARSYRGPHPVVAHPPCARWSKMSGWLVSKGYTPGADGGCFESALSSVRRFGGVLEHPASSLAWPKFSLRKPEHGVWLESAPGEWVTEVWQSAYGHMADKRTWLLVSGASVPLLRWDTPRGTHVVTGAKAYSERPEMPKRLRHVTPVLFAEELVRIARQLLR
jgi:hypothetical protein